MFARTVNSNVGSASYRRRPDLAREGRQLLDPRCAFTGTGVDPPHTVGGPGLGGNRRLVLFDCGRVAGVRGDPDHGRAGRS